jgi:hypothetical protein
LKREDNKTEEKKQNPVQHDGEFVLTVNGSKDFGEISLEIAKKIRRQAGKIRLRIGEQEGKPGDYGEKHIQRKKRVQELRSNGYENARDFVQDVTSGYTAIYSRESGRLTLYKKVDKKGVSLFIELFPSLEGDFYDVKTGMVTRDTYYKNKKPLWEKPQSGQ